MQLGPQQTTQRVLVQISGGDGRQGTGRDTLAKGALQHLAVVDGLHGGLAPQTQLALQAVKIKVQPLAQDLSVAHGEDDGQWQADGAAGRRQAE